MIAHFVLITSPILLHFAKKSNPFFAKIVNFFIVILHKNRKRHSFCKIIFFTWKIPLYFPLKYDNIYYEYILIIRGNI